MEQLRVIEFEPQYHDAWRRLSYEWLEKYVSVEPEDEKILNHPYEEVLNKGGHIFFAQYGGEIVGTVTLIPTGERTFELAKLAVTEKYQGLKIGRKLLETCLHTARRESFSKILLYTNHKLAAAIELYKKFGFDDVPLANNKYLEADIKMELVLQKKSQSL